MNKEQYQKEYQNLWPYVDKPDCSPAIQSKPNALMEIKDVQKAADLLSKNRHDSPDKILARLNEDLRKDRGTMLTLMYYSPRAYLYAHESINDHQFRLDAIKKNSGVYDLLNEEHSKDPALVDAYRYKESVMIGARPHMRAASYNMDPREYYSVEEYQKAYAAIVETGAPCYMLVTGYGDKTVLEVPQTKFIQEAEMLNPEMQEQYDLVKQNILKDNIEQICKLTCGSALLPGDIKFVQDYTRSDVSDYWINEIRTHCPWLEDTIKQYREERINEMIDFIDNNREEIIAAIEDGRISMQDIVDTVGQVYDVQQIFPEIAEQEMNREQEVEEPNWFDGHEEISI